MADYGVKISKPSFYVYNNDERDVNMWSKYQVLKVALSGGGQFIATPANSFLTINHDLGYNPVILFYKQMTSGGVGIEDDGMGNVRTGLAANPTTTYIRNDSTDKDNIYVYFAFPAMGQYEYDYFYYLFYDEGINS